MARPWPMAVIATTSLFSSSLNPGLHLFPPPPSYPPPIAAVPSSACHCSHCFLDVTVLAWLEASEVSFNLSPSFDFYPSTSSAAVVVLNQLTCEGMKHVLKIMALLVAISAFWIGLLETSVVRRSYTWVLPIYLIVSLGCYGLLMVGIGLMLFPTCPQEAVLLQKDIAEAREFLKNKGIDVGSC
ncbi:uncharacterized protein [Elaeis guineensis]